MEGVDFVTVAGDRIVAMRSFWGRCRRLPPVRPARRWPMTLRYDHRRAASPIRPHDRVRPQILSCKDHEAGSSYQPGKDERNASHHPRARRPTPHQLDDASHDQESRQNPEYEIHPRLLSLGRP